MGGNETTVEDKLDRHPLCAAAAGVPSIFAWPWSNCGSCTKLPCCKQCSTPLCSPLSVCLLVAYIAVQECTGVWQRQFNAGSNISPRQRVEISCRTACRNMQGRWCMCHNELAAVPPSRAGSLTSSLSASSPAASPAAAAPALPVAFALLLPSVPPKLPSLPGN